MSGGSGVRTGQGDSQLCIGESICAVYDGQNLEVGCCMASWVNWGEEWL